MGHPVFYVRIFVRFHAWVVGFYGIRWFVTAVGDTRIQLGPIVITITRIERMSRLSTCEQYGTLVSKTCNPDWNYRLSQV